MKRSAYIVFLLCSTLILPSGCRPKGILHSWEMRKVLIDLHKTDAMIQVSGMQYGHDEAKNIYYAQVLEKHGITQAVFDSSLVWYTAHPELFDKIYPKVLAQLKKEEDAIAALCEDMQEDMPQKKATAHEFSHTQLDSVLLVFRHGYPSIWNDSVMWALMHDSEDQLLP